MTFTAPYPLTYDPSPAQSGNPTITRGRGPEIGQLHFDLSSNQSQPSSAHVLSSFGMEVGTPRDVITQRIIVGASELNVDPLSTIRGFFYTGGAFASALTSAKIAVYVEEYDAQGRIVRSIDGPEVEILRTPDFYGICPAPKTKTSLSSVSGKMVSVALS